MLRGLGFLSAPLPSPRPTKPPTATTPPPPIYLQLLAAASLNNALTAAVSAVSDGDACLTHISMLPTLTPPPPPIPLPSSEAVRFIKTT